MFGMSHSPMVSAPPGSPERLALDRERAAKRLANIGWFLDHNTKPFPTPRPLFWATFGALILGITYGVFRVFTK